MKKIFLLLIIIIFFANSLVSAMKVELNKNIFLPGDEIIIRGTTESDGIIKLFLVNMFNITTETKEKHFSFSYELPKNIKAGIYTIYIIFENTKKEIETKNFEVKAVQTLLEIAINKEKFLPKENVTIKATLYDHNFEILPAMINLKIKNSEDSEVIEKNLRSGETFHYQLQGNASEGEWKIEASSEGLHAERYIIIGENEEINLTLEGNKLKIKNMGNIPYKKIINTRFVGPINFSKKISLNLDIGEEIIFELNAPSGEYKIFVEEKVFVAKLTGKTIIKETKKPMQYHLLSFFLFVVLILVLILIFHKIKKSFFLKRNL